MSLPINTAERSPACLAVLSEINVTPLVDVMLVLLVVFIVTAPLLTNAIPINLPKTQAVAPVEQKDPLVVSIDGAGKLFINKDEIQPDLLEFNLQAAKAKDPDVRVQLQADDGVNYGEVGRGPLCGAVVTAAVILDPNRRWCIGWAGATARPMWPSCCLRASR